MSIDCVVMSHESHTLKDVLQQLRYCRHPSRLMMSLIFAIISISIGTADGFVSSSMKGICRPVNGRATSLMLLTEPTIDLATETVPKIFEAQMPSMESLVGFGAILVTLLGAASFWWNVIIPQKRTELSLSKRKGSVNEFLTDLREIDENESMLKPFQRWFFTDWLRKDTNKSPAIPLLKKAKWNSGDNPVLVAFAGIMAFVVSASLAERAGGSL